MGSNSEEEGIPRVWVVLRKLLLALGHDIRILIKDDELGRAASQLSLLTRRAGASKRSRLIVN